MIDGDRGRRPDDWAPPAVTDGLLPTGMPSSAQWLNLFRNAQVPLWLFDVSRVRRSLLAAGQEGAADRRAWLDSHPEFITRAISQLRVLEMSDRAVTLSGARDRDDFRRSLDRLVVPESLESFKTLILATAACEPVRDGESVYCTLDGRIVHAWYQASFVEAADGSELMLLTMTDISRLKETQRRLEESESRYRTLIETARDLVLCHDLEGRYTFANRAATEALGWSVQELMEMEADQLVPEALREEMHRRAEMHTGGDGGVFLYETAYRTADGGELPVEVSSCLIEGRFGGPRQAQVLVVARDISERRRADRQRRSLEAQLRDAQKLESLGVLASGIAHDFNNFLVGILGSAEILRADSSLDEEQQRQLASIISGAGSIADLCRQMQVYADSSGPERRPLDLSRIVQSFARLMQVSAGDRARLSYELAEDLPPVEADEAQIGQILIQLVSNGVEALGPSGGVIAVRTYAQEIADRDGGSSAIVGELAPGRYAVCEVRDSGSGMDPKLLARICEPFFTTRAQGRGMGLFTALGILQQHGGAFRFETQPDRGTTVGFLLPARQADSAAAAPRGGDERLEAVDLQGRTVLVVDEKKEVRDVAESFLRRLGCNVLLTANGYDAVQIFAQRFTDIDFVLLDVGMEGMNGVAAARRLRTIQPAVPIAFVSGSSAEQVRERAAGLEPFGILAKPFRMQSLREVVAAGLLD